MKTDTASKDLVLRWQSYLSPAGSRQGQIHEPWCHSSQQEASQVLPGVKGPSLAASLSFPQQHSHSWGRDRHTAPLLPWHSLLSCPGEVMVSNPVTPRKAARGQKKSQSQAGPSCLFVIILTPRARNPLQTEHQSYRATSHNKSQPPGFQREAVNTIQWSHLKKALDFPVQGHAFGDEKGCLPKGYYMLHGHAMQPCQIWSPFLSPCLLNWPGWAW